MDETKAFEYTPDMFENRELSWLKFNERILNEAKDTKLPLMERVKFLSITESNFIEFFMVRVASLKDQENAGYKKPDLAGMTPKDQLEALDKACHDFVNRQYQTWNRSLYPALKKNNILVIEKYEDLSEEQSKFVDIYFKKNIYPVLTPMAVDASRPFPLIANKSLNIGALLKKKPDAPVLSKEASKDSTVFATVQVPTVIPRLVEIPSEAPYEQTFILLEQIIEKNLGVLFLNYDVICANPYRIIRNGDFSIDEDEAEDLLSEIQKSLHQREWGEIIRIDGEQDTDKRLLKFLMKNFKVSENALYAINGPIDLTFGMKLYGKVENKKLFEKSYTPVWPKSIPEGRPFFDEIKKKDRFVFHPYDSFQPVVDFIRYAADDPQVLAIKQTLYRVSGNSPIVAALGHAAENGKQVTVLVELKARFDEENNIQWAKKLEKAGCHVIYGLVGLKTHCKIALVVREEDDGIRRYVHLGTGNYNDSTAKIYSDCGIFTANEQIGEDATAVFNMLSGYSEPPYWNRLALAPIWLRTKFYSLIDREIANAAKGKKGLIVAKMNSLCDKEMIEKLYDASRAGVRIYLVIRGICCLKTGIKGVSENIHVVSIVGTFLEHARIFYFYNDGDDEVYMGSADWMPRNLDRRVEIIFPVLDSDNKNRAIHILDTQLSDNLKAYYLDADGEYKRFDKRGKVEVGSQSEFCKEAQLESGTKNKKLFTERTFTPAFAPEDDE